MQSIVSDILKRSGMSQAELADAIGCRQASVSGYLSGRTKSPSISVAKNLMKLADRYGVDWSADAFEMRPDNAPVREPMSMTEMVRRVFAYQAGHKGVDEICVFLIDGRIRVTDPSRRSYRLLIEQYGHNLVGRYSRDIDVSDLIDDIRSSMQAG